MRALPTIAALALLPALAEAQVGSTDIITGRVLGPDGQPVRGARVEATSIETGVTRARSTDDKGRYTILFLDGGSQYRVTARMLGLSPQTAVIARQALRGLIQSGFAFRARSFQVVPGSSCS